jgi:hypothetical protein
MTIKVTYVGSNQKIAIPTGYWYLINGSWDTIAMADGSSASVTGDHETVTLGANAFATILGLAETVTVNGTGDTVTLGANGQYASDANLDTIYFNAAGLLVETDNSRVAAYGNNIGATIGANDQLGAFGAGITVTATGANDSVWLGRNGQNASDAKLDKVTFAKGGALYVQDNSRVASYGDNVTIGIGASDNLGAFGSGLTVNASGLNDNVWIGGNGQQASDANLDRVNFAQAGAINIQDNSRVAFYGSNLFAGSNITATAGSNDYVGAFGSGINLTVTGANTSVWIGANGQTVLDTVTTTQATTIYETDHATVNVTGAFDTVYVGNWDTTTIIGAGAKVIVGGVYDDITLGNGNLASGGADAAASISFGTNWGSLKVATYSSVVATGSTLNVTMGGMSSLTLNGDHNNVTLGASSNAILNGSFDTIVGASPTSSVTLNGTYEDVVAPLTPHSTMYVTGFASTDRMYFSQQNVADFAHLLADASQVGTAVVISEGQSAIYLNNTNLSSLTASQFQFT